MSGSSISEPKGELKEYRFKPGVGMIYVDERGTKFTRTRYVRRGRDREQNMSDAGNGRPHMSKKARLRLKKQFEDYKRRKESEEALHEED